MSEESTGLPPGWKTGKTCIVSKPLADFKYVEVRYEQDKKFGHDYALYVVNCDGPRQQERLGEFDNLTQALRAGDRL